MGKLSVHVLQKLFCWMIFACPAIPSFSQASSDSANGFQDAFLNNLVGKWTAKSSGHDFCTTASIEAKWIMAHQHLLVHFTGNENIPWLHAPMEFEYFIGYKHSAGKYVVHNVSVFGDDEYEGFCYGYRNGNTLDLIQKQNNGSDTVVIQRFIWKPESGSWVIQAWTEVSGKKEDVFFNMDLRRTN